MGRVHRIGQTKETFVHRFVIGGTVEEKMYELHKNKLRCDDRSEKNQDKARSNMTVNDLVSLFT